MSTETKVDEAVLTRAAAHCKERGIVIPTFAQLRDPSRIPASITTRLRNCAPDELDPANLFRINWFNQPAATGGLFNDGNFVEFPSSLTGVDARIVGLVGKWFPTGAHKVGAAFGCLVPRLVTGNFDPSAHQAVWPSTGNFCRGGAFDCALLDCSAIGILPEEMSAERFEWLRSIGAEVIATPGCESNVKEIYDQCWEIRRTRPDCVIFNQFEEFGNPVWHYHVTGTAVAKIFDAVKGADSRLAAWVSATGSAGTIAAGDYLRSIHPDLRVVATEALQCPTLYQNGFGGHRIEGIGDKHVPWVHNLRNTDVVAAIDDEQCMALMRLFHEPAGRELLAAEGVPGASIEQLDLFGISSICNLVAAIKTARYYELGSRDWIFTPLTDSADFYRSRMTAADEPGRLFSRYLAGIGTDNMRELGFRDRKALHNLKYFTWVEQQGRTAEELRELWDPDFWAAQYARVTEWDRLINSFNERVR